MKSSKSSEIPINPTIALGFLFLKKNPQELSQLAAFICFFFKDRGGSKRTAQQQ
ncbi:MAG: hypothetical protein AB7F43_15295 [Bacteriovoracia bacterium]